MQNQPNPTPGHHPPEVYSTPAGVATASPLATMTEAMLGRTVSHYRIEEKLGEGGMGVVYRARDLELNRSAAVKFLSRDVADEERRQRFQREAQIASSLNHPHILSVYEAGSADGQQYLITEFVDGVTLREWARRERPSARQILELLTPIADALAAAHQAGIMHRDVKPENILVSSQGFAKLADFGLAKLAEPPPAGDATATIIDAMQTRTGVVIGTIPYMSPEQLTGQPADARSDIFSLGVVLYELLAGTRPSGGKSGPELIRAIVQDDPRPITELRPDVAPALAALVEKTLEKDPADRYQSARELVVDLHRAQRPRTATQSTAAAPPQRRPVRWGLVALGLLIFTAAAGFATWRARASDYFWRNPLAGASFTRLTDFEGSELDAAISRDGKFVAFLSDRDGKFDVWVGQLGTTLLTNLTKGQFRSTMVIDEVRSVGFSADGSEIWTLNTEAFPAGEVPIPPIKARLLPTMGGGPGRPFLDNGINPVWSRDGNRLMYHAPVAGDPIFIGDRGGRDARQVYIAEPGVHCHYLTWSPDERFIYFVRGTPPNEMDVWRIPSNGGQPERITRHNSEVAYLVFLDDRTLLYRASAADGSGLWLYALDIERRIPHRVSLGIEQYRSIAASADGRRLVATIGNPSASLWTVPILERMATESDAQRLPLPVLRAAMPRYGVDGVLFLSSKSGVEGLWKYHDGVTTELWKSGDGAVMAPPAISPDRRTLAFVRLEAGRARLQLMRPDGSGVQTLAPSLEVRDAPSWSPDGKSIVVAATGSRGEHLYRVPTDGGVPAVLVEGKLRYPAWSPDGRFIAYAEPRGGAGAQVKAVTPAGQPFPLPALWILRGERYRIRPGGREIVYLAGEFGMQQFWLLDIASGRRRQLTNLKSGFTARGFDLSADGKEILFDRTRENSDVVLIDLPPR